MSESISDHRGVGATANENWAAAPSPGSLRVSNVEREATVDRLHAALGEGRLDLAETEERLAAAYASRYRSDLADVTADLPTPEPESLRAGWSRIWLAVVGHAWLSLTRACGTRPTHPTPRQQRLTSVLVIAALLWLTLCLLLGFSAGLVG